MRISDGLPSLIFYKNHKKPLDIYGDTVYNSAIR
nr:MAG TPA: hypothetical protein [Caudoviricetes sp.]